MRLPKMKYSSGIRQIQQVRFGGLNHNKSASEGEIYDMLNMSSDNYPLISTRLKRAILSSDENVKAVGDRWIIKGTDFIYDGEVKNPYMPLSDTPKQVVEMGAYVLIFPDKYYYNLEEDMPFLANGTKTLTVAEKTDLNGNPYCEEEVHYNELPMIKGRLVWVNGQRGKVKDSISVTIDTNGLKIDVYGVSLKIGDIIHTNKGFGLLQIDLGEGECVKRGSSSDYFKWKDADHEWPGKYGLVKGDVVLIKQGELEQVVEVTSVGRTDIDTSELEWESTACTASRHIPDFEAMCVCDNRLWGVHDGVIYASKLGEPKNFYVYQSLSTDSWSLDCFTKKFTGAITYNGKPTFWTENSVITVHGSTPSTFQTIETEHYGVSETGGDTMAVVDGYLFYLSPKGICVYSGQQPTLLHEPIGKNIKSGYGYTDGIKYYISAETDSGNEVYVYDTSVRMWHKEDNLQVCGYNYSDGALRVVSADGKLIAVSPSAEGVPEENVPSFVEFADFYEGSGDKKTFGKINIRMEIEEGAEVQLKVKYDSGEWENVKQLTATEKRSFYIPFIPKRCDHYRLRFEGNGNYTIYSISREVSVGSAN